MNELTTGRAVVLYVGALLGPAVLVLPGVAAGVAGPASVLAWAALLGLSAVFAWVFSALGTRLSVPGGVAGYVRVAFGRRAERAVTACFAAGVVAGAPVVCLIGGGYAVAPFGGGRMAGVIAAAVLLVTVVALTAAGARASAAVQLVLVGTLVLVIVVAVVGAAPHARAAHWEPFAPHGWAAVGHAASLLMLSFVGWEAIAPLIGRLRNARRQLPRVIAVAFAITSAVYLGLAITTVAVLGASADARAPVAELLVTALGRAAGVVAAVAAVALTLAAVNAYLSGAAEMIASLRGRPARVLLPVCVGVTGLIVFAAVGAGWLTTQTLIAVPTILFVTVYLGCTAAGARVLHGAVRVGAGLGFVAVAVVAGFSSWALLVPVAVIGATQVHRATFRRLRSRHARLRTKSVAGDPCTDGIRCCSP